MSSQDQDGVRDKRRGASLFGWILALALLGGAIYGAIMIVKPDKLADTGKSAAHAPVAVTVSLADVKKGDIAVVERALGTVTPLANVTVRTQVNGQIMQIGFSEGQTVHAGDFLIQIDPRPYQLSESQAEGNLARDQALLAEARRDLERYQRLVAQNAVSKQQRDQQDSLVSQYEGAVKSDQAQIDTAKLNLDYCHIVSPVEGRIGLRQVDLGNFVQTGAALVSIAQVQPISVIFTVAEDHLAPILKNQWTGGPLTVTAFDRTRTDQLAVGHLSAIDSQIDTATGTVKMRAGFDNENLALFPNQFVTVALSVDTMHDVSLIPQSAIQRGAQGAYVYKAKDDGTVTVQAVKVGVTEGEQVQIIEGLAVGEQVVTAGFDKLRDGAKIRTDHDDKAQMKQHDGGGERRAAKAAS